MNSEQDMALESLLVKMYFVVIALFSFLFFFFCRCWLGGNLSKNGSVFLRGHIVKVPRTSTHPCRSRAGIVVELPCLV